MGEVQTTFPIDVPVDEKGLQSKKAKRRWERAFQSWSDDIAQNPVTPLGKCGYGEICDHCEDSSFKNPCVKALHNFQKATHYIVDYENKDYESVWCGVEQGQTPYNAPLA